MSSASCNDLYEDEFPKSVCEEFSGDEEVLDAWKNFFRKKWDKIKEETIYEL